MALGTFLTSALSKIRNGEVLNNRPNSEALMSKLGANINGLIDRSFYDEKFTFSGFFNPNNYDNGVGGIKRIEFDSKISSYQFSIFASGSSGNNSVNCSIYDEAGAFVGNLFGSGVDGVLIPATGRTRVLVGHDVENSADFGNNIAALAVQYGNLNFTNFLAGWMLIPFVEANGKDAYNANLNIRFKGL